MKNNSKILKQIFLGIISIACSLILFSLILIFCTRSISINKKDSEASVTTIGTGSFILESEHNSELAATTSNTSSGLMISSPFIGYYLYHGASISIPYSFIKNYKTILISVSGQSHMEVTSNISINQNVLISSIPSSTSTIYIRGEVTDGDAYAKQGWANVSVYLNN